MTRVTVCDPMYRCWACGQDIRPLIILPLIITLPLFIEVSVSSQESEWSCMCVILYRLYLFLRFCIGFWNCTDSVVSLFFILFEKGCYTKSLYFLQVMNSAQCKIIYVKSRTFSIFIVCHPKCFINNYWKIFYCQASCFHFSMNDVCMLQ